jgi:hypothetical protein
VLLPVTVTAIMIKTSTPTLIGLMPSHYVWSQDSIVHIDPTYSHDSLVGSDKYRHSNSEPDYQRTLDLAGIMPVHLPYEKLEAEDEEAQREFRRIITILRFVYQLSKTHPDSFRDRLEWLRRYFDRLSRMEELIALKGSSEKKEVDLYTRLAIILVKDTDVIAVARSPQPMDRDNDRPYIPCAVMHNGRFARREDGR